MHKLLSDSLGNKTMIKWILKEKKAKINFYRFYLRHKSKNKTKKPATSFQIGAISILAIYNQTQLILIVPVRNNTEHFDNTGKLFLDF